MTPICLENKARYPKDWPEISKRVRERAGNRCEGTPEFPNCRAVNYKPHPDTGSRVVLTVAHMDQTPENCDEDTNLRALCQRCHLCYDRRQHRQNRIRSRHEDANTEEMFDREKDPRFCWSCGAFYGRAFPTTCLDCGAHARKLWSPRAEV